MRLSDGELRWMQARLAQRYAAAGRDAQEKLERQLAVMPGLLKVTCLNVDEPEETEE